MNKSMILILVGLAFLTAGKGLAQTKALPRPFPLTRSNPTMVPSGKPTPGKGGHATPQVTGLSTLNLKVRQQTAQIRKDLAAHKLTPVQAKEAMARLKHIRVQELEFFRQNGKKQITATQQNQLNQLLTENATGI